MQTRANISMAISNPDAVPINKPGEIKTSTGINISEQGIQEKVLVTGATGFLGNHLIEALTRSGVQIRTLVYDQEPLSERLMGQAQIISGDLRDPNLVEAAMHDIGIVYHCAAVTKNNLPWKFHYDTNVRGTENILNAAIKNGVKKVVHISSVIVYGFPGPSHHGFVKEADPYPSKPDPWDYYMRSKIEAEKLALKFYHEFGLPVTVLRLGILYGPGMDRPVDRGLFQLGSLRFIIGTGQNRLPYTYTGNAVECILQASFSSKAIGQAFNVVDNPPVRVRELMELNMQITGKRSILVPVPSTILTAFARVRERRAGRKADPIPPKLSGCVIGRACRDLVYDSTKAKEMLGWEPAVSLKEGLKKTFDAKVL